MESRGPVRRSDHRIMEVNCVSFVTVLAPPPVVKKRKKLGKNPNVDTSFLPDRDREVSAHD